MGSLDNLAVDIAFGSGLLSSDGELDLDSINLVSLVSSVSSVSSVSLVSSDDSVGCCR